MEQQQAAAAGGAAAGARAPLSREGLGALVAGVVDVVPARGRTVLAQVRVCLCVYVCACGVTGPAGAVKLGGGVYPPKLNQTKPN